MNTKPKPSAAPVRSGPEKCLLWYAALTPVWWATGLLTPIQIAGIIWLYVTRPRSDRGVTAVAWLWFAVGISQDLAEFVNWAGSGKPMTELLHRFASLSSNGWVLLGMCLSAGAAYGLTSAAVVRAICIQGAWMLVLSAASYLAYVGTGISDLEIPSLLSAVIPAAKSNDLHFTMRVYLSDEFLGTSVFRLILFFPWSTGLALAGLLTAALAPREPSWTWRLLGLAGGLTGLVLAYSRAVFVGSAVALSLMAFLRCSVRTRLLAVMGAAAVANGALLAGFDPSMLFGDAYRGFTDARPGSSEGRDLLYAAAWNGFLQAPWIGHGWFGPEYARWMPIAIGSHSTFFGVLYKGGVITFAVLCTAFAVTLAWYVARLREGPSDAALALSVLIVYGMVAYGENLDTLVPSLALTFLWLGGAMAPARPSSLELPSLPPASIGKLPEAWTVRP